MSESCSLYEQKVLVVRTEDSSLYEHMWRFPGHTTEGFLFTQLDISSSYNCMEIRIPVHTTRGFLLSQQAVYCLRNESLSTHIHNRSLSVYTTRVFLFIKLEVSDHAN